MINIPNQNNVSPPRTADVKLPPDVKDPDVWREAVKNEARYSMNGLLVGIFCILSGTVLLIHGVAGSVSWTTQFLGLESTVSDAAPGALLFIIGFLVIFLTKHKVEST